MEHQAKWDLMVYLGCREWLGNVEGVALEDEMVVRERKVYLECKVNKAKGEVLADKASKACREPLDLRE